MTTATVPHTLVKPKPGEVAARQAHCSCGQVITGISRKDAADTIRRHAYRANLADIPA